MKISILNVAIDNVSREDVIAQARGFLHDGKQHKIFTPNPEMLVLAHRDRAFRNILNQADLLTPDGFGLLLASIFLGTPFKRRITGVDLLHIICDLTDTEGLSIFLLGGKRGVGKDTALQLKLRIRNQKTQLHWLDEAKINVNALDKNVLTTINSVKPDILFVALGHGKQERFIQTYLSHMPTVKIAIGVGGALDFIAGRVHRAPTVLQKIGLEWLWRLYLEPWRLIRIINAVIIFPILIFYSKDKTI